MSFVPSIHDVQITVNAENCCNGCCFPFLRRRKAQPKPSEEKVEEVVKKARRTNSLP
jgi:hypothetical protein